MPAPNAISPDKLTRIIGTPRAPFLLDVRSEDDFAADPRLLPVAIRIDDQATAPATPSRHLVAQERANPLMSDDMPILATIS